MADQKISQLASGAPAQAGDEYVVARAGANYKLTLTNIAANMPATTVASGNLTFSGTGQRITGDMSNATESNRVAFQTSTTNGGTRVNILTNGTGTASSLDVFGVSDPTNAAVMRIRQSGSESQVLASITGTGTYLPMTFYTGGSERMRLTTDGNLGIGTASPSTKLHVFDSGTPVIRLANATVSMQTYVDANFCVTGTVTNNAYIITTNNAERMRIDSSGNVGIGGTASATDKLTIAGTLPSSSAFSLGAVIRGTIPSASTSGCYGFATAISTQAASFTSDVLRHFSAEQGTLGASSALTNQYGFIASSNLTGATNNFGFFSDIASGSNRWNFYAAGTARNYFAGDTGFGVAPSYPVDVLCNSAAIGIQLRGRPSDNISALRFRDNGNTTTYFQCDIRSNVAILNAVANIPIEFYTNNTVRARLTADGEFITGGTTDQGAYNLQCNGTGVWGAGAYVNGSDARLKDNIQSLDSGLDVVKAMRPVTFQYKPEYSKDQSVQPGFIAQELQTAMAGKPYLEGVVQEGTNHLNVAYQNIIPILVKAIQELSAKVAALEAK